MLSLNGRLGLSNEAMSHRYITGEANSKDQRQETLEAFLDAYDNNVMCFGYRVGTGIVKGTKPKAQRIYELADDRTKAYIIFKARDIVEAVIGFSKLFCDEERLRG